MTGGRDPAVSTADGSGSDRLFILDLARAVALSQMVVFHFVTDMELFGLVAPGTTLTGGWAIHARAIVTSFMFLSGISLVLAHGGGFRARAWLRRFGVIVGAAGLVSFATYFAVPSHVIYFGILHAIAAASLLGLPFLFAPVWAVVVAAVSVLIANALFARELLGSVWLAWTGLGRIVPASLDFIPVVPWFAPFLLGIAFARIVDPGRLEPAWPLWFPVRTLAWPGRHSLAVYLIHQPVLIALLWVVVQLAT